MVRLFQVPPAYGLSSGSPFCARIEVFLKLANIPYESVTDADPRKSPKGKVPWIEDGGTVLGDSGFIIEYLTQKYNVELDAGLTDTQRAIAHTAGRMLTETFYWYIVQSRWLEPDNWSSFKRDFLKILPPVIGTLILPMIRKKIRGQINGHGIGLHTRDELWRMCCRDIDVLTTLLGDNDYFFGDKPTTLDGDVYSFLASLVLPPFASPGKDHAKKQAKLMAHCRRMHEQLFPELTFTG